MFYLKCFHPVFFLVFLSKLIFPAVYIWWRKQSFLIPLNVVFFFFFTLYGPFVFQMGSKSGKWRPPWTKTKLKLWVHFHQSALRACMDPKALAQLFVQAFTMRFTQYLEWKARPHTPTFYISCGLKPMSCSFSLAAYKTCDFFCLWLLV